MAVQLEKLEKNMAKLTIEVPAEEFEKGLQKAYQKMKNRIQVPGFRKGKAPRKMIEKMYGAAIFYEDAANEVIPEAYEKAVSECEEIIVSRPDISVEQIEEGKPFIFTAEVALKPEVTLGEYMGLEVEKAEASVSEEDVDREIDRQRENNARNVDVTDRPVQQGDIVKLDFEGFVDGVPFEGGKGTDYPLTIGSGSFIPGFEDQLVGAAAGEEKEVNVTFPENYQAAELAGKAATFKCVVKEIKEKVLPEADDEFAQDVSDFDTIAEYRDDIRAKLLETKTAEAKQLKETRVVAKAVENAQMDIPEAMIADQVSRMAEDFRRRIEAQGLTFEQYVQFTGMTPEQMTDQMRPEAETRIKNSLVLEAIAKAENIEASEEKVEERLSKMAESYKMELDKLKEIFQGADLEQLKADLAIEEAVEKIVAAAKEI